MMPTVKSFHVPCDPDTDSGKLEEAIHRATAGYAEDHGWELNPDSRVLDLVIRGLVRNCKRFGKPYCPCRIRSGDPEKGQDIICPCIYHQDEVIKDGHCHCNLFFGPGP